MTKKKSDKTNRRIYKKAKFEKFLELIAGDVTCHWVQIANVLGINQDTIVKWKKLPLAQKAIRDGIQRAVQGMEKAGTKDWRMWESKLKMLGVAPVEKIDHSSLGEKINVGVVSYAGVKPSEQGDRPKKVKKKSPAKDVKHNNPA